MRIWWLAFLFANRSQIIKSANDPRDYYFSHHPSGMRVFIIKNPAANNRCSALLRLPIESWNWREGPPHATNLIMEVLLMWIEELPAFQNLRNGAGEFRNRVELVRNYNFLDIDLRTNCVQFPAALTQLGQIISSLKIDRQKLMEVLGRKYVWTRETLYSPVNFENQLILSMVSKKTSPALPPKEAVVKALIGFIKHRFWSRMFSLAVEVPPQTDALGLVNQAFAALPPFVLKLEKFSIPILESSLQKLIRVQSAENFPNVYITTFGRRILDDIISLPFEFLSHLIENPQRGSFLYKLRHNGSGKVSP